MLLPTIVFAKWQYKVEPSIFIFETEKACNEHRDRNITLLDKSPCVYEGELEDLQTFNPDGIAYYAKNCNEYDCPMITIKIKDIIERLKNCALYPNTPRCPMPPPLSISISIPELMNSLQ